MEIEMYKGGITDLQRFRSFVSSLPTKQLKNEIIKRFMEERDNSLFSQEDIELIFISDNWDELVKLGWLAEC